MKRFGMLKEMLFNVEFLQHVNSVTFGERQFTIKLLIPDSAMKNSI